MSDPVRSRVTIRYPYTHSTGPVIGPALGALRERSLLGARCPACRIVLAPAREWCDRCGAATDGTAPVGPGATVTVAAPVHEPTPLAPIAPPFSWALLRLDGADTDLLHVVRGAAAAGDRVRPVWRAERRGSVTDIECFEPGEAPAPGPAPAAEPVAVLERPLELPFTLCAGSMLSRAFRAIREERTLYGVRCTACRMVIVPPRVACPRCWVDTEGWIALPDRGTVTSFVVVNVPFHGQQMPLPYVLAHIRLDGADTSFLHVLGDVDPAATRLGMRVRARWREGRRTGFPNDDIVDFRPTGEPDAPAAESL